MAVSLGRRIVKVVNVRRDTVYQRRASLLDETWEASKSAALIFANPPVVWASILKRPANGPMQAGCLLTRVVVGKRQLSLPPAQGQQRGLTRSSTMIAVRDDGTPWESEKDLQTRVSHFLRDLERDGLIGAGTTLHGLRVSYAAWWKRNGATDAEVADLLGDKSQRMGTHYTRHVTREDNVIRAFRRVKDAS